MAPTRVLQTFVLVTALVTCGDSGTGPSSSPGEADGDGDGFTPQQGDCDDANAAINPDGDLTFEEARYEPDSAECILPRDNDKKYDIIVLAEAVNNSCESVTINAARVTNEEREAEGAIPFIPFEIRPKGSPPGSRQTITFTSDFRIPSNPRPQDRQLSCGSGTGFTICEFLLAETTIGEITTELEYCFTRN